MSAPLLQQTSPADNLSGVAATANLVLTFDQIGAQLHISGTRSQYRNTHAHGGLGLDTLAGGGGNDTFNILAATGSDVIVDFSAGAGVGDVVVLDGFSLGTFNAVQAAMTQNGANTVLNLGSGQTLTFLNVLKSAFAANDFTFLNVQGPPPPPPGRRRSRCRRAGRSRTRSRAQGAPTTSRARAPTTGSTASRAATR